MENKSHSRTNSNSQNKNPYKREKKTPTNVSEEDFEMIATTFYGLEDTLSNELLKLGAKNIDRVNRAVSFYGDKGFLYKSNLCLRTALRILKPIKRFFIQEQEEFYQYINYIEWENYLDKNDTLAVDAVINTHFFNHSQFVAQRTKDAIVDRFMSKFKVRPSVDKEHPTVRINIHIYRHDVTVSIDSSGTILHKRGYRDAANIAPLNEVLAAGLVMQSGWDWHIPFIDGMCGSGTIAIEAALIGNRVPPGILRKEFGFMKWKDFDQELYDTIFESCVNKIEDHQPNLQGLEILNRNVKIAKKNVANAKVDDVLKIIEKDFFDYIPDKPRGVLFLNPPYGERMGGDQEEMIAFYKKIGDKLKKDFNGFTAWIITANLDAAKHIGLRPSRKITFYNGALECKLLKFELYEGTKKIHKIKEIEN